MEICPAGPPKLINPSLSQNPKACQNETLATFSHTGVEDGVSEVVLGVAIRLVSNKAMGCYRVEQRLMHWARFLRHQTRQYIAAKDAQGQSA